jgi:hypothetical protein
MEKGNILFTPEYHCDYCNEIIYPVCPEWEKSDGMGWANILKRISFEFKMDSKNEIYIKSKNDRKILLCKNCNNTKFKIIGGYFSD